MIVRVKCTHFRNRQLFTSKVKFYYGRATQYALFTQHINRPVNSQKNQRMNK